MTTFGENLRRERELRGVTLLELANATKISLRYLQALEAGHFEGLPAGIFGRGFVRSIARYLKIDEHYWVGEYVRAAGEDPEVLALYTAAPPPAAPSYRSALSFVLLVVVFGAAAYFVREFRLQRAQEEAKAATPAPAPRPEQTVSAEPARHVSQVPTPPVSTVGIPPRPALNPPAPKPPSGDLQLQVDALDDAWVSVALDGEPSYQGLMQPGQTQAFRATQVIDLVTGNASAVVLTLNGETLAPLGNPGERKTIRLTAKDLSAIKP